MRSGRQLGTRTRVLRWLLTLLALAGLGLFPGEHCLDTTPATSQVSAIETVGGPHSAEHAHDAGQPGVTDTVSGDCHLQLAPVRAATIAGLVVHPPMGTCSTPSPATASTVRGTRLISAVTLTRIGVSRT